MYKTNYIPRLSGIFSRYARLVKHPKINVIHNVKRLKKKNMII